ncbi:MAG: hypothetical protein ACKO38_06090, partial [Planctomycetota bacterium]
IARQRLRGKSSATGGSAWLAPRPSFDTDTDTDTETAADKADVTATVTAGDSNISPASSNRPLTDTNRTPVGVNAPAGDSKVDSKVDAKLDAKVDAKVDATSPKDRA